MSAMINSNGIKVIVQIILKEKYNNPKIGGMK
jgi:hypothetical protein